MREIKKNKNNNNNNNTNPPRQVHFVRVCVCGNICILISVDTLCDEFCSR
jgi:hypothetical protein